MIIHLVTAADGKEEYYTLDNNTARSETPKQARELDIKTANAWIGHNNLKIIDNSTEFNEKLDNALNCVHNLLGNPIPIKKQRKFKVDLIKSKLDFLVNEKCTIINIEQIYLNDNEDLVERRLRKKTIDNESVYYYTEQRKYKDGLSEVVTDKKITEKDYLKIKSMYNNKNILTKTRYAFIKDKQYFRLDIFDVYDFAILEIEPTNENQKIKLPKYLVCVEEVTNDPDFQNIIIANQKKKEKGLRREIS